MESTPVPPDKRLDAVPVPATAVTGMRVAVVDDDPLVRVLAARILVGAGARITTFASGDAAWEAMAGDGAASFDAVLTDIEMPGTLDGIRLAQRLARTATGLRVVVMSSGNESLDRARAAGLPGLLAKPFSADALIASVARRPRS